MIELTWPEINLKPFIVIGIMAGNWMRWRSVKLWIYS